MQANQSTTGASTYVEANSNFRASDLQVAILDGNFAMEHQMGLAEIVLKYRTDVKSSTTVVFTGSSQGSPTYGANSNVLASETFKTGTGYLTPVYSKMDGNDKLYYAIVNSNTSNTLFDSNDASERAWDAQIESTIGQGKYISYNARCKDFKAYTAKFAYGTSGRAKFTVPGRGVWKVECWGASGGVGYCRTHSIDVYYGYGAYTVGNITLSKSKNLFVYVGGQGTSITSSNYTTNTIAGGWNGGGYSVLSTDGDDHGGTGGGASDVRLSEGTSATDWNSWNTLKTRIMVAAGGGGGHTITGYDGTEATSGQTAGLHGGGVSVTGQLSGWNEVITPVVNQENGFALGQGVQNAATNHGTAGGGGGWYGGVKGSTNARSSGGSSFISGHTGCKAINQSSSTSSTNVSHLNSPNYDNNHIFSETKMIDGRGYAWTPTQVTGSYAQMPKPGGGNYGNGVGHTGSGYVIITYVRAQ